MKTLICICLLFSGWSFKQDIPITGRWQLETLEVNHEIVYSRNDSLQSRKNYLGGEHAGNHHDMAKKYRKDSVLRMDSARQNQSFRSFYNNTGKNWLQFNEDHSFERLLSYGGNNTDTTVQKGQFHFSGGDQLVLSIKGFAQSDTLRVSLVNNQLVLSPVKAVSPTVYTYSRLP